VELSTKLDPQVAQLNAPSLEMATPPEELDTSMLEAILTTEIELEKGSG
jgi:hypothetical protein